jgi:hypothetical protein
MALSRLGAVNDATATDDEKKALFLKRFTGIVKVAFERANVIKDIFVYSNQTDGKQGQVPVIGRIGAQYYDVDGTGLTGLGNVAQNEVNININAEVISDIRIARIDELMDHIGKRQIYATEMGRALARLMDRYGFRVGVLGARQTTTDLDASLAGLEAGEQQIRTGSRINFANDTPTPDDYVAALFLAQQAMDEKDVPEMGRKCYLTPRASAMLSQSSRAMSMEFGGRGNVAEGRVPMLAGFELIRTNNLRQGNITAPAGEQGQTWNGAAIADSSVDTSNTEMLCACYGAIGAVELSGVVSNMTGNDYFTEHRATLLTTGQTYGLGYTSPECLLEIYNSGTP